MMTLMDGDDTDDDDNNHSDDDDDVFKYSPKTSRRIRFLGELATDFMQRLGQGRDRKCSEYVTIIQP